jgi:hypothetical protein
MAAAAAETHELRSLEEFRAVAALPVGVIVITDTASPVPKAHVPACRSVAEEAFTEKVLTNRNRNGHYFYFLRLADASQELGAAPCPMCAR